MLVLVVGPSGAGKDTLLAGAQAELGADARFRFVRRDITRPLEAGGEVHRAVSVAQFEAVREAGGYALSWGAHGLLYGIPADIGADVAAGVVVVANVSRGVIAEAEGRFQVMVLEITAPAAMLAARLAARGREVAGDIAARLARRVEVPAGMEVVEVVNDGSVAAGVGRVLAALSRAAGSVRPT